MSCNAYVLGVVGNIPHCYLRVDVTEFWCSIYNAIQQWGEAFEWLDYCQPFE